MVYRKVMTLLGVGILVFLAHSCVNPPDFPSEPEIEFISITPSVYFQKIAGNPDDTIAIKFSFKDGEGDIGFDNNDPKDIFVYDNRDDFRRLFSFPVIPDEGSGNGIKGEATILIVDQVCCIYPDGSTPCLRNSRFPRDTISFSIEVRDREGNMSNRITTDVISIVCD